MTSEASSHEPQLLPDIDLETGYEFDEKNAPPYRTSLWLVIPLAMMFARFFEASTPMVVNRFHLWDESRLIDWIWVSLAVTFVVFVQLPIMVALIMYGRYLNRDRLKWNARKSEHEARQEAQARSNDEEAEPLLSGMDQ